MWRRGESNVNSNWITKKFYKPSTLNMLGFYIDLFYKVLIFLSLFICVYLLWSLRKFKKNGWWGVKKQTKQNIRVLGWGSPCKRRRKQIKEKQDAFVSCFSFLITLKNKLSWEEATKKLRKERFLKVHLVNLDRQRQKRFFQKRHNLYVRHEMREASDDSMHRLFSVTIPFSCLSSRQILSS